MKLMIIIIMRLEVGWQWLILIMMLYLVVFLFIMMLLVVEMNNYDNNDIGGKENNDYCCGQFQNIFLNNVNFYFSLMDKKIKLQVDYYLLLLLNCRKIIILWWL